MLGWGLRLICRRVWGLRLIRGRPADSWWDRWRPAALSPQRLSPQRMVHAPGFPCTLGLPCHFGTFLPRRAQENHKLAGMSPNGGKSGWEVSRSGRDVPERRETGRMGFPKCRNVPERRETGLIGKPEGIPIVPECPRTEGKRPPPSTPGKPKTKRNPAPSPHAAKPPAGTYPSRGGIWA